MIKYMAMFAMLLNHISNVFMTPGSFLAELFLDIGYFTAITMCYFLVEGYGYTRSKKKYALRLLLFALISEIPYCLAFTEEGILEFYGLNMMFTLLICFLILLVRERVGNPALRIVCIGGLLVISLVCDWALLAPVFTILFDRAKGDEKRTGNAFLISMLWFGAMNYAGFVDLYGVEKSLICALGSMGGIALSAIVILYFYNGKRAKKGRNFSKWFFYWFYPVHLLILGLLRIVL